MKMIFKHCKIMTLNYKFAKFEQSQAKVFFKFSQNTRNFNLFQFYPSMLIVGFPVFHSTSSSTVESCYCETPVNSICLSSVLKLPKAPWPSSFNSFLICHYRLGVYNFRELRSIPHQRTLTVWISVQRRSREIKFIFKALTNNDLWK